MSTNNSSQTLFRFVSLRNPQLTETEPSKNLGFVHKPKTIASLFDGAIPQGIWDSSNGSKILALENQIPIIESQNSNYFYKTKKEVQTDFADYFIAAELIAKNKLENIESNLPTISNNFPENYAKLWDNLIYQVLTQKDFYVKEAISQVIKAIHFNLHKNSLPHEELRNAKIVLPGRLFVDTIIDDGIEAEDTPNVFTVNESLISNSYITEDPNFSKVSASAERRLTSYAEKNTELALAISEKSRLDTLKSEIELVSKNYQREYSAALSTAQDNHQAIVTPLMNDYDASLEAVRNTFTPEQTPEEQQALLDAVPYPTLPIFEFNYPKLDTNYLKEKLSQPSFETMADVLQREYRGSYSTETAITSGTERILPVEGTYTLEELNILINKQQSEYASTVVYATEVPQQEYANIGGALVPIQNVVAQNPFSAVLTTKANVRWNIFSIKYLYDYDMVLEVPDSSWELEEVKCEVKDAIGNVLEYTPKEFVVDGVKLLVNNIFNDRFSQSELEGFTEFTAKVYFKNNREGSLVFKLNNPTSLNYFAKLNLVAEKNTKKAFNPKNFGIKRLGVADYLKVVQSIHAYVPGEVSNIENVMASELRHKSISERTTTEDIKISSKSQEVEKMTDTTKVNRSEMQSEVAKELDREQSIEAHTSFSAGGKKWQFEIGGSYANHTAQHDSTRQAVTKAQEITERALERVVTKISEERIQKIVHDVQLQNVHEFDNRGKIGAIEQPKHITGVYRWVDKKMKNQVYNYGLRTMFEFMVPEPARLHRLATKSLKTTLVAPIDPRKVVGNKQMKDANVEETLLKYWADYFKVKLEAMPEKNTSITLDKIREEPSVDGGCQGSKILNFDEKYIATSAKILTNVERNHVYANNRYVDIAVSNFNGGKYGFSFRKIRDARTLAFDGINTKNGFLFEFSGTNVEYYEFTIAFQCTLSSEFISSWKKTAFDDIIAEYDKQYTAFQDAQKAVDDAAKAEEEKNKEKTGAFYREMESNILKHNCIAYLLQDYNGIGKALSTDDNQTMESFSVTIDENLDAYTALAKFLEQAFEWNVMDYTFYPYYWAENKHWKEMYLSAELDPLFRNFLQAGMARVVVTVKPGFEDAVNFYMSTGKIWNGGEVPVIGDPMFLSIADELKQATGKPQGKYWITSVPTSLTILQAKSAGLEVTNALPVFPETDIANCENPEELVTESPFKLEDIAMQSIPGTGSTIS